MNSESGIEKPGITSLAQARIAWVTRREPVTSEELPSNHAWGTDRIFALGAIRVPTKRIRWIDALGERLRLGPNITEQIWLFFNRRKYDFIISKDTDLICMLCGMLWLVRKTSQIIAFLHFPLRSSLKDFFVMKRCNVLFALSEKIHQLSLVTYPGMSAKLATLEWAVDISFYDRIRASLAPTKHAELNVPERKDGKLRILLIGITGRKFQAFVNASAEDSDIEVRILTDSPDVLQDIRALRNFTSVRKTSTEPVPYARLVEEYLTCDIVAIPLKLNHTSDADLIRHRATLWGITTLLEASALAKPVVMTFNPLIAFDPSREQCGLVLHKDDTENWRNAIQWCKRNKSELQIMGERARKHAIEHYNMPDFQEKLLQILETYCQTD
jgi:hypothetical protein